MLLGGILSATDPVAALPADPPSSTLSAELPAASVAAAPPACAPPKELAPPLQQRSRSGREGGGRDAGEKGATRDMELRRSNGGAARETWESGAPWASSTHP